MRNQEGAWRLGFLLALGAVSTMVPLNGSKLLAATYTVNTESDDNGTCEVDDCALREAILAANASPGMDVIILPSGQYELSLPGIEGQSLTGDLDILDELELRGAGSSSTFIVGDGSDRVMTVFLTSAVIADVTITGGRSSGPGGGLSTIASEVTLINSLITQNHVTGTDGGGIFVGSSNVVMIGSTVSENSAAFFGGGIHRFGLVTPSNLTLINSTVSGNFAYQGGGIYSENAGDLILQNSTIAHNTATSVIDDLFMVRSTEPFLTNTLIVGECGFFLADGPISNGGNIESPGATCFITHPTDRMNVPDPGIGVLAANGGPTSTHALLAGSPAIDSAEDTLCQTTDQRGLPRPADGDGDGVARCDVGAFERIVAPEVEIPTLGTLGLGALALLLALAGFRASAVRSSRY